MAMFTQKIAKQIALKSFGHVLDCLLGVSDSGYVISEGEYPHEFEQNFEEDLQELGIPITERRIKSIGTKYVELEKEFCARSRRWYARMANKK